MKWGNIRKELLSLLWKGGYNTNEQYVQKRTMD